MERLEVRFLPAPKKVVDALPLPNLATVTLDSATETKTRAAVGCTAMKDADEPSPTTAAGNTLLGLVRASNNVVAVHPCAQVVKDAVGLIAVP